MGHRLSTDGKTLCLITLKFTHFLKCDNHEDPHSSTIKVMERASCDKKLVYFETEGTFVNEVAVNHSHVHPKKVFVDTIVFSSPRYSYKPLILSY